MIRYLSVCSGIEAFSKAVEGLPYSAVGFSEIDAFPRAVLAARYPFVPNMGDMTKMNGWALRGQVDLLVGGTPCQDLSVAGKREGLSGERSGLAWHYVRLAAELRVPWLLWENVPGAVSASGGRDFRSLLSALDELGYGLAWAVLDAQWFGVPQRRKRLFLVGRLGDWRGPCQVLFEPGRVCGNPPPRVRKRQGAASCIEGCSGTGGQPNEVSPVLTRSGAGFDRVGAHKAADWETVVLQPNEVAPAVTASGAAFSRTGQHGTEQKALVLGQPNDVSSTLCASGAGTDRPSAQCSQEGFVALSGPLPRRFTPVECERLMGFPDGWTDVTFQGKPARDTLRYKALGNSMAVPVMRWLAEGILKFF